MAWRRWGVFGNFGGHFDNLGGHIGNSGSAGNFGYVGRFGYLASFVMLWALASAASQLIPSELMRVLGSSKVVEAGHPPQRLDQVRLLSIV